MSWRVIWIPELLGAVLGGIFVFRLGMGTMPKTVLHACEEFTGMLRESRRYENWVTGTEKKLRKNGAKFHYGKKITPVKYLLMRLFLSLGAVLTLESIGWGYALLAAMGLYYVPELLLLYLNRQDNHKMMPDLSGTGGTDLCRSLCNGCLDGMLPERTDAEITAGFDGTVRRSGHTVGSGYGFV